jgi:probable HAF family extracellular repeat protein
MGGQYCLANAINDSDQIAGSSTDAEGLTHGFVWQDGAFKDLGYLAGQQGHAPIPLSINKFGAAVGYVDEVRSNHAFMWDGLLRDLDSHNSYPYSEADYINDAGTIVGMASKSGFRDAVPARFDGSNISLLQDEVQNIGKWTLLGVGGLNNKGEIAGWGYNGDANDYSAFILVPINVE